MTLLVDQQDDAARPPADSGGSDPTDSRRRFTRSILIASALAAIPYLWVLWDRFSDPLRSQASGKFSNFYELQARALFHGHFWVPKHSLGIEAFVVDGRDYTYFGPFLSFLRMPILAVTSDLDGRLTAPSMLLAWVLTAVFTGLLLWRVRILVRGPGVLVSRAEAVSYGALTFGVLGGSVLVYLAASPWVYNEDFAWGVALAIGGLFALVGVLEQPTTRRVVATGALATAAVLTRSTMGWACVLGALLVSVWLFSGRGGDDRRRWWWPVLLAGLVPLAAGCTVAWIKFGGPFSLPFDQQVWSKVNAHRRHFLEVNDGRPFNLEFLPTTLRSYLRPDGLRVSPVFPFFTPPARPPEVIGGVVMDMRYRTASIPASMPLLFLLGVWGLVTAFRPHAVNAARLLRIPLFVAGAATSGVLVWSYIANRYLAEFMPLLVIASAVAMADVWRRLDGRARRPRVAAVAVIAVLAAFGMLASGGSAIENANLVPEDHYAKDYIEQQQSISDRTGHPLDRHVVVGTELPGWAPAGQIFALTDCAGLYLSTGELYPPRWIAVEQGPGLRYDLDLTFDRFVKGTVPLVTMGQDRVSEMRLEQDGRGRIRFRLSDPTFGRVGPWIRVERGRTYDLQLETDTTLHAASATLGDRRALDAYVSTSEPWRVLHAPPRGQQRSFTLVNRELPARELCESLAPDAGHVQPTPTTAP